MATGDEPTTTITIETDPAPGTPSRVIAELSDETALVAGPDICSLALQLPATDVCSLMCDPPAMAAYLIDEGMEGGRCYQLRCELPDSENVLVGVCL
jgi:hypothetical protein